MFRLVLLVVFGCVVAGCNDGISTVLADIRWTLQCAPGSGETCQGLSDTPTCLGDTARRVRQFDSATVCDGEIVRTTCRGVRTGSTLNLDLGATVSGDNYRFEVDRLNVDDSGTVLASPSCQVEIAEDEFDYGTNGAGACGGDPPSDAQPCQILDVVVSGTTVDLEVLCTRLTGETGNDEVVNVRGPGASGGATLHFENCEGF